MDYPSIAEKLFAGTKYEATKEDIKRLANNMSLLEERGLSKLNQRLIDSGRGIWDTIAEHNFAVLLVSRHDSSVPISYEPDINGRPPDFKVEIGDITYWISMKNLARLQRENRQDKMIQKIKVAAKEIKVGKFFSCMLSDNFKEGCLLELIDFMKDKAVSASEEESFLFTGENTQKAEIKFWPANNIELSELTLGCARDWEVLNLTGLENDQIKQSLRNAAGAFNWGINEKTINLIVMEADNKEDIDICDALFGTEYEILNSSAGHVGWCRKNGGLFKEQDFFNKVAGVIAIKRKPEKWELSDEEKKFVEGFAEECNMTPEQYREQIKRNAPISDYYLVLYMNDAFRHLLEDMKRLLSFDKIVYYNMRPPMGEGNFKL